MANILVVEDDSFMPMTIRFELERTGYSVAIADDGPKGFAAFKAEQFDLVLLDIFMPTMDGLETLKPVREWQPKIPISAMSDRPAAPESSSEPDFLALAIKFGAVKSRPKPFKPATLPAMVADCLAAAAEPPAPDSDVAPRR